jgi:hypothetical protein
MKLHAVWIMIALLKRMDPSKKEEGKGEEEGKEEGGEEGEGGEEEEVVVPFPDSYYRLPVATQNAIIEYIDEMDELHFQAYLIAYDHLKTSFSIDKSNGFIEWQKARENA